MDVCLTKILAPTLLKGRGDGGRRGGGLVGLSTKTAHTNQPEIMALVLDPGRRVKRSFSGQLQGFIELWPAQFELWECFGGSRV